MKLIKFFLITCIGLTFSVPLKAYSHDHSHMNMEGTKADSKSLYQLKSNWLNQDKKTVKLESFKGKPVIMTMLYTTCKNSCPLIMSQLKFLEQNMKADQSKVNFVIVSLDPERDNPEVFKKFAIQHNVSAKNWHFLNGKPDDILELAALLGIKYRKNPDGEIMHTNKLSVLNKSGEIIFQQEDLNNPQEDIIKAIKQNI